MSSWSFASTKKRSDDFGRNTHRSGSPASAKDRRLTTFPGFVQSSLHGIVENNDFSLVPGRYCHIQAPSRMPTLEAVKQVCYYSHPSGDAGQQSVDIIGQRRDLPRCDPPSPAPAPGTLPQIWRKSPCSVFRRHFGMNTRGPFERLAWGNPAKLHATRRIGHDVTSSLLSPRISVESRHSCPAPASARWGNRRTSVPIAICPSARARGAPRQKCAPAPKAR